MNYLNITLIYYFVKAVNLPLCSVIPVFLQVFKIQISVRYCVESLNAGVFSGVYSTVISNDVNVACIILFL